MLNLDRPDRPLSRTLLDAPGGFAWWYADAMNEAGTGWVCIWSFGLPFLPGYYGAARQGQNVTPAANPSLNLALYDRGSPVFYALHRLQPAAVTWEDDRWRFGKCTFERKQIRDTAGHRHALHATLDLPVPGSTRRLQGQLSLEGTAVQPSHMAPPLDGPPLDHAWTPLLAPAHATADLTLGGEPFFRAEGTGYHDRNGSRSRLDDLGIGWWTWTRLSTADRTLITYLSFPKDGSEPLLVVSSIGADGQPLQHAVTVQWTAWRTTVWGQRVPTAYTVRGVPNPDGTSDTLEITHDAVLDASPFYSRGRARARFAKHTSQAHGIWEVCHPDKIDGARMRPLVRMAVQDDTSRDSMWLPLFVGPRHDRVQRLLTHWRGLLIPAHPASSPPQGPA